MASTRWILLGGVLLTVIVLVAAVSIGAVAVRPSHVVSALFGEGDATLVSIVRDLRAPRALLAALVGAGLSMSGGALQGTMRNPLAEPYLLGVSGGAAVGAVIATAFGIESPIAVTISAFAGAVEIAGHRT